MELPSRLHGRPCVPRTKLATDRQERGYDTDNCGNFRILSVSVDFVAYRVQDKQSGDGTIGATLPCNRMGRADVVSSSTPHVKQVIETAFRCCENSERTPHETGEIFFRPWVLDRFSRWLPQKAVFFLKG